MYTYYYPDLKHKWGYRNHYHKKVLLHIVEKKIEIWSEIGNCYLFMHATKMWKGKK